VRFRWEYQPGSDFFVVYSEGRNTAAIGAETLSNRSGDEAHALLRF
jgi:hypothetical protein